MSDSEELARLADLHQRGALSDEEFARAKARLLNGEATARSSTAANPALNLINSLRRSREDRWLGGVCGGIAQLSGIAAWFLRLVFALLLLCGGTGLLIYLLMWVFVPLDEPPVISQRTA